MNRPFANPFNDRVSEFLALVASGTLKDDRNALFAALGIPTPPGRPGADDDGNLLARLSSSTSTDTIASVLTAGSGDPTVTTDLDDYAPGATAEITASGFDAGASVTFEVDHIDEDGNVLELGGEGHDPWTVVDGGDGDLDGIANGTIVTDWYVNPDDSLWEEFILTATDGISTASTTFTDGAAVDSDNNMATVDLTVTNTTDPNVAGTADQLAAVMTNDIFGAGTGVIDPFVRIQRGTVEQGVNTSGPTNLDEKAADFTRNLLLSDIAGFTDTDLSFLPPGFWREFRLDINENSNAAGDEYLSLDDLKIFVSTIPNLTLPSAGQGNNNPQLLPDESDFIDPADPNNPIDPDDIELVWDLDSGIDPTDPTQDRWIALNYDLQAGSGVGDIAVYINEIDFDTSISTLNAAPVPDSAVYVYLYSAFGYKGENGKAAAVDGDGVEIPGADPVDAQWDSSDGFEEWSVLKAGALPPASLQGWKMNDEDGIIEDVNFDLEGLNGWIIQLWVDDGDEIWDPLTDTFLRSDITAPQEVIISPAETVTVDGYYSFDMIESQLDYFLVEVSPTGVAPVQDAPAPSVADRLDGWIALDEVPIGVLGPFSPDAGTSLGTSNPFTDYDNALIFHNFELFDIAGTKFTDVNGDGDITGDPAGTPGQTFTIGLYNWIDTALNPGEVDETELSLMQSTETDELTGDWAFFDLGPLANGVYFVREEGESGWVQSFGEDGYAIDAHSGNDSLDNDFGNYLPAAISGIKLEDEDGDGIEDPEDTSPIAGIVINLYDDGGSVAGDLDGGDQLITSTVTASDGTWSFGDLDPGVYNVEEVLSGTDFTSNDKTDFNVTLTSGQTYADNADTTFLNFKATKIQGIKLEDEDGDGNQDAEDTSPIAGIVINLYDDSGSVAGDLDGGDQLITSTVTASDGSWSFDNLAPGVYSVEEVLSGTDFESNDATDFTVTLSSGEVYGVNADTTFLNYLPAAISGIKLEDEDGDGNQDAEDTSPIAGIVINLYDAADALISSTVTGTDGTWSFGDLDPGVYTVEEVLSGTDFESSDTTEFTVTLTSGQTYADNDDTTFLNYLPVSIEGRKFWDDNRDGVKQDTERFASGWVIELYLDNGNGTFGVEDGGPIATDVTDINGVFMFDDLDPGETYFLKEVLQDGFVQTTPSPLGDGVITVGPLTSGQHIGPEVNDPNQLSGADGDIVFGNDIIPGTGNRTPGFWQSDLGKTFYDGDPDNDGDHRNKGEEKEGDDFPDNDLFFEFGADFLDANGQPGQDGVDDGFLIGDWDGSGDTTNVNGFPETHLAVTIAELCVWVDASQHTKGKGGRNKVENLERDLGAAWLNFLAGNDPGDPSNPNDIAFFIDAAIKWLDANGPVIRAKDEAWKESVGGLPSGSEIQSQLNMWNESGDMEEASGAITQVNFDGDDWTLDVAQNWLATHQEEDQFIL